MPYCKKNPEHGKFDKERCPKCHSERTLNARKRRKRINFIPAAPVHALMRRYAETHALTPESSSVSANDHMWDVNGIGALSNHLGISKKRVLTIFEQDQITFDLADKIVTKINVWAWHEKGSELQMIYNEVPLDQIDGRLKPEREYPDPGSVPGTQAYLAKRLGVSRATVSNVIKNRKGASEALTEKILSEAQKMGLVSL